MPSETSIGMLILITFILAVIEVVVLHHFGITARSAPQALVLIMAIITAIVFGIGVKLRLIRPI